MSVELADLHDITADELAPLLLEEAAEWEHRLAWDFSRTASLVRKFTAMRALDGIALLEAGTVIGYGYTVMEDDKGVIGDLYVRPAWRNLELEQLLFRTMLDQLLRSSVVQRVESQLMTVDQVSAKAIQRDRFVRLYERTLMFLDDPMPAFPAISTYPVRIDPWSVFHGEAAAAIITQAYYGHVDSQINDQYRTMAGARKFVQNLLDYPGCGVFFAPASFVAVDQRTGNAAGMVLSSIVSNGIGHISQLCTVPSARGSGLGRELLQRAMNILMAHGSQRISLTVTLANVSALQLYERGGFRRAHDFHAYVWEAS